MSAFGTFLIGVNPVLTFILCIVPRVLAGWIAGLVYNLNKMLGVSDYLGVTLSALFGSVMNTVLFSGTLLAFFWKSEVFVSKMVESQLPVSSRWKFITAFVGVNGLIEALVATVVGAIIAKALGTLLVSKRLEDAAENGKA